MFDSVRRRHRYYRNVAFPDSCCVRVAQVAPLCESVPPPLYGGTERVVANLCDALVTAGHEVTLFASADSWTKARLVPMRQQAIRLDPAPLKSDVAAHLAMLHSVRARAHEFDVLHFHVDLLHFPIFEDVADRTMTTLHGRLDIRDLAEVYRRWPQYALVSISDSQRMHLPHANWLATVHHGIPADRFSFSMHPDGSLAFVGRISPEKRVDRAVEVARRTGRSLVVAAKVDPADAVYFRQDIEPLLREPHVRFLGEQDEAGKNLIFGAASALLFPIDWPEPFGLVMIEAMACGTPVIAWDMGSVREVVEHGVTGFIVHSIDEAVDAVHRVHTLDRRRVRETFERRFSADVMSRNYLRLYAALCRQSRLLTAVQSA
jgi:glycosyltransferase involved in cell wall biosynthesis